MKLSIIYDYKDIKSSENDISEFSKDIRNCIKACLKMDSIQADMFEVYIKFTTNDEIQKINKEHRDIDKATDVLSFPMYEKVDLLKEIANNNLNSADIPITLGDIVISVEKIKEQAKEYRHSFKRELIYLTTHSMFHLLGYDHINDKDKKIMREMEDRVMAKLEIMK